LFREVGAHLGHARHAADKEHLLDLGRRYPGVLQAVQAGLFRAVQQVRRQCLKPVMREEMCEGERAERERHTEQAGEIDRG
jgi:hypothetical protein